MKPTIENIIEKYKNVNKVRCANSKATGKVDFSDLEITPNGDIIQNKFKKNWIVLYFSEKDKYAEIISYKKEIVPVPLRLIKELCKEKNIEEILIREGIIEDDKLEVGDWYVVENIQSGSLSFDGIGMHVEEPLKWNGLKKQDKGYYFQQANGSIWRTNGDIRKATESEVFEALKKEALKRGFKEGVSYKTTWFGEVEITEKMNLGEFKYNNNSFGFNTLCVMGNPWIFKDGIWATIMQEETYVKIPLSEIKNNPNNMLLGKLVRNIADNY